MISVLRVFVIAIFVFVFAAFGCDGCGNDDDDNADDNSPNVNQEDCDDGVYYDKDYDLTWTMETGCCFGRDTSNAYCASLSVCGYTDWRMPTLDELRMLIDGCANTEFGGTCTAHLGDDFWLPGSPCQGCPQWNGPGVEGSYYPPGIPGPESYSLLSRSKTFGDGDNYGEYGYINFSNAALQAFNFDSAEWNGYETEKFTVRCVRGGSNGS